MFFKYVNECNNSHDDFDFFKQRCCYFVGVAGLTGPTGQSGGVINYADFYALMSPDNAAILTITPLAGGVSPVSAHLVIMQIA